LTGEKKLENFYSKLWEVLQQVKLKEVTSEENEESENEITKDIIEYDDVDNESNITCNINTTKFYT